MENPNCRICGKPHDIFQKCSRRDLERSSTASAGSPQLVDEMAQELQWALDSLMRGERIEDTWHSPTYKRITKLLTRYSNGER